MPPMPPPMPLHAPPFVVDSHVDDEQRRSTMLLLLLLLQLQPSIIVEMQSR